MNALRESVIRHPRKRRRPVWAIVLFVVLGTIGLFGVGFALSVLLRGQSSPEADEPGAVAASMAPLPCSTTMVTPAEVLPRTSRVTINVYNGTKRQGLAGETAQALAARGFLVKEVANDPEGQKVAGVAEIRYGPKGAVAAQLLSFYLPGAEMLPDDRSKKVIDVVIGKQYSEVQGEAQVAAALASPSPSTSGPGCAAAELAAEASAAASAEAVESPTPSLTPSASVAPSAE
ncbi:unannotated protein [freshwater metagenome]|uniref:Unannotated protein n=1 Tax=freshwater metagenome TaxID=449393 RepID=A0A6J7I328_9ZZZZ